MSKQSEAKKKQTYNPKPDQAVCANCASFASDIQTIGGTYGTFDQEKNLRCSIGGFKVMKRGTCTEHKFAK